MYLSKILLGGSACRNPMRFTGHFGRSSRRMPGLSVIFSSVWNEQIGTRLKFSCSRIGSLKDHPKQRKFLSAENIP